VRARVDEEKKERKVQRDRKAGKQTREIETEKKRDRQAIACLFSSLSLFPLSACQGKRDREKGKETQRKRKTGRGQADRRGGKRIHACMHSFIHSFMHTPFSSFGKGISFLKAVIRGIKQQQ
jgi:hypothetical protein